MKKISEFSFARSAGSSAAAAKADKLEHECTSWIVFPDLTKNNTIILHKNRDDKPHNVRVMQSDPRSPRRWIGLGNNQWLCMGMNASALAGVMNSGEKCVDHSTDSSKKDTPAILRFILETCDTAKEAVSALRKLIEIGDYWHGQRGSIYFFIDPKEGYICEMTAKFCSVQRYDHSYAFRANKWHNPDMAQFSRDPMMTILDNCVRETVVQSSLNAALDKNGLLTLNDMLNLSRHSVAPKGSPLPRSVCSQYTNSAATQVIHREFPQTLSTIWVLIGHPRHTIYLPIPICAEKLLPSMETPEWSVASWKRFDARGLNAKIPTAWLALEKRSIEEYEKAVGKAEKLLHNGKKEQAVKLLNQTAAEIWKKAYQLAVPAKRIK